MAIDSTITLFGIVREASLQKCTSLPSHHFLFTCKKLRTDERIAVKCYVGTFCEKTCSHNPLLVKIE
jgi:hypothetical protein